MARFNRTFYDLNNERHYCFAVADERIPVAVLSDLKLSVPDQSATPVISGIFIQGETVRITIAVGGEIVASYVSENRSLLRRGKPYPLKSWNPHYEGILVFGDLTADVRYEGAIPIAEECLSRYVPSAIPYVSIPCTAVRLTGEVYFGGDGVHTVSYEKELPVPDFGVPQSAVLDLADTEVIAETNPMLLYANGVNALNEKASPRSPIYSIYGVKPNGVGTLFIDFEDYFKIAALVEDAEETVGVGIYSTVAVGTAITQDDVCHSPQEGAIDSSGTPENCEITPVQIGYRL